MNRNHFVLKVKEMHKVRMNVDTRLKLHLEVITGQALFAKKMEISSVKVGKMGREKLYTNELAKKTFL
jgi:hypothetical protein